MTKESIEEHINSIKNTMSSQTQEEHLKYDYHNNLLISELNNIKVDPN